MTAPAPAILPAVEFTAPEVAPAPGGLYSTVTWTSTTGGPSRFLTAGIILRPVKNYGGLDAVGVWGAPWCGDPGDERKEGERPESLDAFAPITVWSYDECDLTAPSQVEVRARALHNLKLLEPVMVEREFAARLLADAGPPTAASDLPGAVGELEEKLATTNTLGTIHCRASALARAEAQHLVVRDSASTLRTPAGHRWAFGGGYAEGLGDVLVATSPVFGWRDAVQVREVVDAMQNEFIAIAERSVVIAYEASVGAAEVGGSS